MRKPIIVGAALLVASCLVAAPMAAFAEEAVAPEAVVVETVVPEVAEAVVPVVAEEPLVVEEITKPVAEPLAEPVKEAAQIAVGPIAEEAVKTPPVVPVSVKGQVGCYQPPKKGEVSILWTFINPRDSLLTISSDIATVNGKTVPPRGATATITQKVAAAPADHIGNFTFNWADGHSQTASYTATVVESNYAGTKCEPDTLIADPTYTIAPATCEVGEVLSLSNMPKGAVWNSNVKPTYTGPAKVTIGAMTDSAKILFASNGSRYWNLMNKALAGPLGYQSVDPSAECFTTPEKPAPVTVVTVTESEIGCDSTEVVVTTKTTNVGHRYDEETNSWIEDPQPSDRTKVETEIVKLTPEQIAELDCPIVVVPEEPVAPAEVVSLPRGGDNGGETLASTGANPALPLGLGILLMLMGVAGLVVRKVVSRI